MEILEKADVGGMSRVRGQPASVVALVVAGLVVLSIPSLVSPVLDTGGSEGNLATHKGTSTVNQGTSTDTVADTTATSELVPSTGTPFPAYTADNNTTTSTGGTRKTATSPPSAPINHREMVRGIRTLRHVAKTDPNDRGGNYHRAVRLATAGIKLQSGQLNGSKGPSDPTSQTRITLPTPEHDSPSSAVFALYERYPVDPTAEQAANVRALDNLPEPTRSELTDVLDAYLGYSIVTRRTYADINTSRVPGFGNASDEGVPVARNGSSAGSNGSLSDPVSVGSHAEPQLTELEVQRVRAAQLVLLEEVANFSGAVGTATAPGLSQTAASDSIRKTFKEPGVLAIDLTLNDSTYENDYAFLLDRGGDDTYDNNAGGGSGGAAALIDLAGNDRFPNGKEAGVNGGGTVGAGFLLNIGGDDTYTGGEGSNGGGKLAGVGFLLDSGGSDTYTAESYGTNGGGYQGGKGFLLDTEGDDTYSAGSHGTNGGGRESATGTLIDVAGDDTYTAESGGVNGGAKTKTVIVPIPAVGMLVDTGGDDTYNDGGGPEEPDDFRYNRKGRVGIQVDLQATDKLPHVEPPSGPSTSPSYSTDLCVEGSRDSCDGDETVGQAEDNDTDAVYGTVQAAVDDAHPGETVEVRPDTYHENVSVATPNLTLVANHSAGIGDVTLDGGAGTGDLRADFTHGVQVQAAAVNLTGFTIQGYDSNEIAIVAGANQSIVRENTIHGSMAVSEANGTAIHGNHIDQNNSGLPGLTVATAPYATVANNTVTGGGIILTDSPNTTVAHNTVEDISAENDVGTVGPPGITGPHAASTADSPHSVANVEPVGIMIIGGRNQTVAHNTVRSLSEDGAQDGPVGIAVVATNAPAVTNNSVTDLIESGVGTGPVGIAVAEGSATTVTQNSVNVLQESGPGAGPSGITVESSTLAVPIVHNHVSSVGADDEGRGGFSLEITASTLDSPMQPVGDNELLGGGGVLIANSTVSPITGTTFAADIKIVNDSTVSPLTDNTFAGSVMVANSTVSPIAGCTFKGDLRIHGTNGFTVADNNFSDAGVTLGNTTGATVSNNTFSGTSGSLTLVGTSSTTVFNNSLSGLSEAQDGRPTGIEVLGGNDTTVTSNSLVNFDASGGDGPVGIRVKQGRNTRVVYNSLDTLHEKYAGSGPIGIDIVDGTNVSVAHNLLSNLKEMDEGHGPRGVKISRSSATSVKNNTIEKVKFEARGGPVGIMIGDSPGTTVGNNSLTAFREIRGTTDNPSGYYGGIVVNDTTGTTVTSNSIGDFTFSVNGTGINLTRAVDATVRANTITGVDTGVAVDSSQLDSVGISRNRFDSEMEFGVRNEGPGIANATFNYWGDPTGPSSPNPDKPLNDPVMGAPASGLGAAVSEGNIDGRSNVHFFPWLLIPGSAGGESVAAGLLLVEGECDNIDADGKTGSTENVDDDPIYGTIQGAADAADPGGTIIIGECTYPGNVTIDTAGITLNAVRTPVLTGDGVRERGLTITAQGVSVSGLTVRDFTGTGITVVNADATIINTTLRGNGNGTFIFGSGATRLVDNWFHNNEFAGLALASNATVADETVFHNRFQNNDAYGVYNGNGTATVNATYNHWGAFDAPSSPNGSQTTLRDPETGSAANGSGDAVSVGAKAGVSNVHFAPYNVVHYRWDIDYFVDDDGADCVTDITSIEDGLNESSDGDTVVVCAGTYHENVTVSTDDLTLRGSRYADKPAISGWVKITNAKGGNGQTLRDFHISNPRPFGDGIIVKSKYLTIGENNLTGNYRAILRRSCGNHYEVCGDFSLIVNNNITGNTYGYHASSKGNDHPSTFRGNLFANNDQFGIFWDKGHLAQGANSNIGVVMAVDNTWECGGPSGGWQDPKTGRTANGSGDRISRNVRFDPFGTVNYTVVNGEKVPCTRVDDPSFDPGPEENHSDPTVQELSVSEVETSDPDAEFNVDWKVNDSDGDLEEVELTLVDDSAGGTNEQHMEKDASGNSEDRVTRMVAATDDTKGHNYTVKLEVRDEEGNTSRATETIRETEPRETPTASWPSEETETPDEEEPGGSGVGPGKGNGTGPGTGGSGESDGTSTGASGGEGTAEATVEGEPERTSQRTSKSTASQQSTAVTPPSETPSVSRTPPVTPTPEIVPGFGVVAWIVGLVLLVGLIVARRRE